jgi:hypothetical protein
VSYCLTRYCMMAPDSQIVKSVLGSMMASFCQFMVIILGMNGLLCTWSSAIGIDVNEGWLLHVFESNFFDDIWDFELFEEKHNLYKIFKTRSRVLKELPTFQGLGPGTKYELVGR